MTDDELHAWVVASRAAQGLGPTIEDTTILEAVDAAVTLGLAPYEVHTHATRARRHAEPLRDRSRADRSDRHEC
jgi:hypothetical protein